MIYLKPFFTNVILYFFLFASIPWIGQSQTEQVSTIREDGTGNFRSLKAWQAAYGNITNGDLVSANKIAVARIEGKWTKPDTLAFYIGGWKTDKDHYVKIYTTPEARHKAKEGTGYCMKGDGSLNITIDNIILQGIEFYETGNTDAIYITTSSKTSDYIISHNVFHGNGTSSGCGVYFYVFKGIGKVYNNILYNVAYYGWDGAIKLADTAKLYIYNNTIASTNGGAGIMNHNTGVIVAKNNLIKVTGTSQCMSGLYSLESDYNYSSTSDKTVGLNDKISQRIVFVDSINHDFHLPLNDVIAKNKGENLRSDTHIPITDDIDGNSRYGFFDVGADEVYTGAIDSISPSKPGNLTYGTITSNSAQISWSASTDNVGVTGYNVFQNGQKIATVSGTSYTDTTVVTLMDYSYAVSALDAAGNESAKVTLSEFTSPLPLDKTPPHIVVVFAEVKSGTTANITWTTDDLSTSEVEYGSTTSYGTSTSIDNTKKLDHLVTISGLSSGTYHFRVKSTDQSGNQGISDDFTFICDPSLGRNLYVDGSNTSASDSNNGSETTPWKTIQHAVDAALPGDTVIVKPGSYEYVVISKGGGSPGNFVTIRASVAPDKSHVNVNEIFIPSKPHAFGANPAKNAVIKGFAIEPSYGNAQDIVYIRIQNFEITQTGTVNGVIYIGGVEMDGRISADNITSKVHHIQVIGNFLHDLNPNGGGNGIGSNNHLTSQILIKNNRLFRTNGTGLQLFGQDWLVEGNEVSHTMDTNTSTGDYIGGDCDACRFMGSGHIIRNNYLHECLDEEQKGQPHIDAFQTFAVWADQFAFNILVEGNYCYDLGQMFMSSEEMREPGLPNPLHDITFRNNVLRKSRAYAILITKKNDHFTFINNTISETFYGGLTVSGQSDHITILNNLFYESGFTFSEIDCVNGSVCDYNLYYRKDGNYGSSLPQFEKHSIFGKDPALTDPLNFDFRLKSSSAAINMGTRWPDFSIDKRDYSRNTDAGWDIGAYEYFKNDTILTDDSLFENNFFVKVYPNPVFNKLTVYFYLPESKTVSMLLYDIEGRQKILINNINHPQGYQYEILDVTNVVAGVYFLKFISGNYKTVKKIVVLRN